MIIDAHTHGMSDAKLDDLIAVGGPWAKKQVEWTYKTAKRKPFFTDVSLRVAELDKNGYDYQLVSLQWGYDCNMASPDLAVQLACARVLNDNLARFMEESGGRLLTVGTIPMAGFQQGALQEADRLVKTLGLKGISIPSNISGEPIDAPQFEDFWAYCNQNNVPVFIHPADPVSSGGRKYEAEYDLMHNFGWPFETQLMLARLVFSGIMERYPNLTVVGHHLGGGIPFMWGRTTESYNTGDRPYDPSNQKMIARTLPKPIFDYFSMFYYDTAVGGSGPAIRCAYDVFGADRIIYATDAPFGPGDGAERMVEYPKVVASLGLPEADREKIMSGNIRRILGI
ncbi:amidohydrolase family protein [Chloroflexota bacterium]